MLTEVFQMEKYWKNWPQALSIVTVSLTTSDATSGNTELSASVLSYYNQYCCTLLATTECDGWKAELQHYLKDMPADVSLETDIVEWWQVCLVIILHHRYCLNYQWNHCNSYSTLARIALDILPMPAS